MTSIAPVSVTISERAPMLILDARLALAPGGLLLAVRLAREAQVWLPCKFWDLIDQAEVNPPSDDEETIREALLWKSAWYSGALHGTFFWVGEARREGVLPEGMDSWLPTRHEWLDRGLNPAEDGPETEHRASDLVVCSRQSLALGAALGIFTPIVLTVGNKPSQRRGKSGKTKLRSPQLCRDVALVAQATAPVPDRDAAVLSAPLKHGRIEAALKQMHLSKAAALAAVHVAAPLAVDFGSHLDAEEVRIEATASDPEAARHHTIFAAKKLWIGAQIFWHELR